MTPICRYASGLNASLLGFYAIIDTKLQISSDQDINVLYHIELGRAYFSRPLFLIMLLMCGQNNYIFSG